MSTTADALRELHRIHRQQTDLKDRLARGPKQIDAGEGAVQRLRSQFDELKAQLTRTRVESDEKQLQLTGREDRVADLNSKLNTCSSNREFQTLKEQIAADRQANNVLSDEILEKLERIEELQAQIAEAEEQLNKTEQEFAKTRERVEKEHEQLKSQLSEVVANLEQSEKTMPMDVRTNYQRVARSRGEDALAEVDGGCCGSCYTRLSPQTVNELHLGQLVFCQSCGALLYLPEGSSIDGT